MPLITDVRHFLQCDGRTELGLLSEPCKTVIGPAADLDTLIGHARAAHWEIVTEHFERLTIVAYCPRHDPGRTVKT